MRKLDDTLSATPAMLLSGTGNLEDNFKVTQYGTERGIDWVRMEPKRDDTDFKWVRLGFDGAALRSCSSSDKLGQTTQLEFSKLERNPPLDPVALHIHRAARRGRNRRCVELRPAAKP